MGKRNYVYKDPSIERFDAPNLHEVHIDSALTNVSIAYRNETYVADKIFPIVKVVKQSDYYFVFDKAAWFRNEAGVRAMGGRAPRVEFFIKKGGPYMCVEWAAAKGVPDEVVDNADEPLKPYDNATDFVTEKLLLKLENDVATSVFTAANWTNSGSPSVAWSNDTSDPIKDVVGPSGIRETLRQAIGRYPNTVVLGATVWAALQRHPDILDRVKYTQLGIVTESLLSTLFQIPRVLIGTAIINSAKEGATDSFSDVWGNYVWFGWVPPAAAIDVPAAGYVFAWKDRQVNRYREDQEHQDVLECLMNYDVRLTSADSGYLLSSVT